MARILYRAGLDAACRQYRGRYKIHLNYASLSSIGCTGTVCRGLAGSLDFPKYFYTLSYRKLPFGSMVKYSRVHFPPAPAFFKKANPEFEDGNPRKESFLRVFHANCQKKEKFVEIETGFETGGS